MTLSLEEDFKKSVLYKGVCVSKYVRIYVHIYDAEDSG